MLLAPKDTKRPQKAAKTQADAADTPVSLIERVIELEHVIKGLQFEWNEMHEKFSTLHARLSKRAKRDAESAQVEDSTDPEQLRAQLLSRARQRYGRMS